MRKNMILFVFALISFQSLEAASLTSLDADQEQDFRKGLLATKLSPACLTIVAAYLGDRKLHVV